MTTNQNIEHTGRCPLCDNTVSILGLAKLGLSVEELSNLKEYVKAGKMKDLLNIAGIAMRWLGDPEKTNIELRIKSLEQFIRQIFSQFSQQLWTRQLDNSQDVGKLMTSIKQDVIREITRNDSSQDLDELKQGMNAISTKLVGTGIGRISERVVIHDLKRAMINTMDSFSEERASKQGGTDIIATVREKGVECGRVSISVKNTDKWESEFLAQLKKNMRDDVTQLGILATREFPAESLSEQMYLLPEIQDGKTVMVVKPEYVSLAYFGLRHVAVHLFEAQQMLQTREEGTDEAINTFKTLIEYINGSDFQQNICHIDNAIKDAQETRNFLNQMRIYINNQVNKLIKSQNSIEENLNHAKDLMGKLRKLLNGSS